MRRFPGPPPRGLYRLVATPARRTARHAASQRAWRTHPATRRSRTPRCRGSWRAWDRNHRRVHHAAAARHDDRLAAELGRRGHASCGASVTPQRRTHSTSLSVASKPWIARGSGWIGADLPTDPDRGPARRAVQGAGNGRPPGREARGPSGRALPPLAVRARRVRRPRRWRSGGPGRRTRSPVPRSGATVAGKIWSSSRAADGAGGTQPSPVRAGGYEDAIQGGS